ncbi:TfoX/Sxy family protein [Aliihoeflea sp. 40Bstr573]|uniref:TfoX/Sxy family protein n=1 Tax=Aliihoeflea sp. 40Bstr573 TaxID=2696467 RepID=UPI00209420CD|nr:TfoX/Sxy family protein [Aliihoeflea sp. 40Bstr573]MCO6385926.1 competence protein TfoX [Aliihoeflea sp. 40Bstr573]
MQPADLIDMFAEFGPVTVRRMFGDHGIYYQGRIIALHSFDEVWLKADGESAPVFAAASSRQWVYEGKGKPALMPYWSVPDAALDDPAELAEWARKADAASRRAEMSKKVKPSRRPS